MGNPIGNFRFAPQIIKRLGEELNPNPEHGLLELVKNAYDADATEVSLSLERTATSVVISDNGNGIPGERMIDTWLIIGRSEKSQTQTTDLGRTPSGSKGLGRIAALRLGTFARIRSRPIGEPGVEHEIAIDWSKLDGARTVEDVHFEVTSRRIRDWSNGTTIELSGLRHSFDDEDAKRLARGLLLLSDPFSSETLTPFRVTLDTKDFESAATLVSRKYFSDAEYHLTATLKNGKASARVLDWKGNAVFSGSHSDIRHDSAVSAFEGAPDADFSLWVFVLDKSTFDTRTTTISEVRSWLKEFGGVHLYENGLKVQPYGGPGNDWLDMNLRRAQNPEARPSTNTSIGRVAVTTKDGRLRQKTDRSGFIETAAFAALRSFAQNSLEWLARKRLSEQQKRRIANRSATQAESQTALSALSKAIGESPPKTRPTLRRAFKNYAAEQVKQVSALKAEIQLYRTLSTAGITAATFAHESTGNSIKVIDLESGIIRRQLKKLPGTTEKQRAVASLDRIDEATKSLNVLGVATLQLLSQEQRRNSRVDINRCIDKTLLLLDPLIKSRDIAISRERQPGSPSYHGPESALQIVIVNLLNNSIVALESLDTRAIRIATSHSAELARILVSDSGKGISGISIEEIWTPGATTKPGGTGLGLAIVRDTIADLGGRVEVTPNAPPLGGAQFDVTLPII